MVKSGSIVISKPQQGFDLGDTKTKDCVVTEIASGESKVRNIWEFSPLVPSKQEKNVLVLLSYFCSVCIFFKGSVFTFQFLNDKIHN